MPPLPTWLLAHQASGKVTRTCIESANRIEKVMRARTESANRIEKVMQTCGADTKSLGMPLQTCKTFAKTFSELRQFAEPWKNFWRASADLQSHRKTFCRAFANVRSRKKNFWKPSADLLSRKKSFSALPHTCRGIPNGFANFQHIFSAFSISFDMPPLLNETRPTHFLCRAQIFFDCNKCFCNSLTFSKGANYFSRSLKAEPKIR